MPSRITGVEPAGHEISRFVQRVSLATGLAAVYGLLEWLLKSGWRSDGDAGALFAIGTTYPLFGLVIGSLVATSRRIRHSRLPPLLIIPSLLLLLDLLRNFDFSFASASRILVLLLVPAVLFWLDRHRGTMWVVDGLNRTEIWWGAAVAGISLGLLQLVSEVAYTSARLLAIGIPLLCSALLVLALVQVRRRYVFAAYALALVGCVLVALHNNVPTLATRHAGKDTLPNILLVTIDTLRADHVGAYAYPRARTPTLDSLAYRGHLFAQAIAPGTMTGPSHASILTGRLPERHGALRNLETLSEDVDTLADLLRPHGYVTAAFPSSFTTEEAATGLPSRFDWYDDDLRGSLRWIPQTVTRLVLPDYGRWFFKTVMGEDLFFPMYRPAAPTARLVADWLEHNGDIGFFVWLHFYDPHLPYQAPASYLAPPAGASSRDVSGRWYDLSEAHRETITSSPDRMQRMLDLYDSEIAYVDHQLGALMTSLTARSPERELITIVTADHGESMGEHNLFWNRDHYDPTLRVPLIIASSKRPLGAVRTVADQVRLIDIAPTILELVGAPIPPAIEGKSLLGLLSSAAGEERAARSSFYPPAETDDSPSFSIREDGWKLIWRPLGDGFAKRRYELYDLRKDADELRDLVASATDVLERMKPAFDDIHLDDVQPEQTLTEEQKQRLRSLGYIR